jgi:Lrp/AsnC family transcriptional regulator for asnA, asnC and gidA
MDRIEQDILKLLVKNPRTPFLRISEKLGISSITVQKKFEKMRKDGAFFGVTLIIDLSRIGFQGKAFLFITTEKGCAVEKIVASLKLISNLFLVSEMVGNFDLLVMIAFREITEIQRIVNDIRAIPCVEKVELAIANDTYYPYKEEYSKIDPFKPENAEIP